MRRLAASWIAARRHRGQRGQTLIIMAFLSMFLVSLIGLVVDTVRLYILSVQALRAAEAGALAGALYMPNYFDDTASPPSPDGQNAVKRACAVLKQNGITSCPVAAGQVGGQVSTVAGKQYNLQVTVTLQANLFFMALVSPGLSTSTITRSASAQFLPPIQLGSRQPYFGDQADNLQKFWAYINGPYEVQEHGDAYTPLWQEGPTDPQAYPDSTNGNVYASVRFPTSTAARTNHPQWGAAKPNPDQHPTGFTGAGGTLGYNYQIVIPQGTPITCCVVQIYNPAFTPRDTSPNPTSEGLDSACYDPAYATTNGTCTITDNPNEYMQMTYSLYRAPLSFERNLDTLLTSKSYPSLDLYQGDQTRHGCTALQAYNPVTGTCVLRPSYIDGWTTLPDSTGLLPQLLGPGTYRLVAEAGTIGYGRHGYGIKITDTLGNLAPSGVRIWGWNDMSVRFNTSTSGTTFDLGQIPAAYAGKTLNFSLFDPGDGNGDVGIEILNPSGVAVPLPNWVILAALPRVNVLLASSNGDRFYNGQWLHLPIPIPANYNPTPGNDWWQIRYTTSGGAPADTITISISLGGSPIHLVAPVP